MSNVYVISCTRWIGMERSQNGGKIKCFGSYTKCINVHLVASITSRIISNATLLHIYGTLFPEVCGLPVASSCIDIPMCKSELNSSIPRRTINDKRRQVHSPTSLSTPHALLNAPVQQLYKVLLYSKTHTHTETRTQIQYKSKYQACIFISCNCFNASRVQSQYLHATSPKSHNGVWRTFSCLVCVR